MRFRDDEPGNLVRARAAVAAGRAEHPDGAEASSPEPDWATDPATLTRVSEALTRQLPAGMPMLAPAGAATPAGRPLPRRRPGGRHARGRA